MPDARQSRWRSARKGEPPAVSWGRFALREATWLSWVARTLAERPRHSAEKGTRAFDSRLHHSLTRSGRSGLKWLSGETSATLGFGGRSAYVMHAK